MVPNNLKLANILSVQIHSSDDCPICDICQQTGHLSIYCPRFCKLCESNLHSLEDCQRCYLCKNIGHWPIDCIYTFCMICNQEGHLKWNCKYDTRCTFCKEDGHTENNCENKVFYDLMFLERSEAIKDTRENNDFSYTTTQVLTSHNNEVHFISYFSEVVELVPFAQYDTYESEVRCVNDFTNNFKVYSAVYWNYDSTLVNTENSACDNFDILHNVIEIKNQSSNNVKNICCYDQKEPELVSIFRKNKRSTENIQKIHFQEEITKGLYQQIKALLINKFQKAKNHQFESDIRLNKYNEKEDNQWAMGDVASDNYWT